MIDKDKIIEEEIIRDEVRKILGKKEQPESRMKRFLDFFNAPLGLFILTTIFVSFGSFLFSQVSAAREAKKDKAELLYKLTNEVNYRFEIIKEMNKGRLWEIDYFSLLCAYFGFEGPRDPDKYYIFKSLYKEYEHRTLNSLIVELNFVIGEEDPNLREVIKEFTYFEKAMSFNPSFDSVGSRKYKMANSDSINFEQIIVRNIDIWRREQQKKVK